MTAVDCFHCGETVPNGSDWTVTVFSESQAMCCPGCQAVCETIVDQGLSDYYKFRSENAQRAVPLVPEQLANISVLDEQSLQQDFVIHKSDASETLITLDGMTCSACAWLIERQLSRLTGVLQVNVNATNQRATVRWDDKQVALSDIITRVHQIGYQAYPFKQSQLEKQQQHTNQQFIRRLGVAGLFTAQVMMFAVALYFGVFSGIDDGHFSYFRWVSMALATPVILYSAQPFLTNALRALKVRSLNMDVPVSLAIFGAYFASCWATFNNTGEVYFESVTMFTLLLLIGRYLEFKARSRATAITNNLLKYTPLSATLLDNEQEQSVSAKSLKINDMVRVKPGEMIPADGQIISGQTSVNESMISGEHLPVSKNVGDTVLAGSINHDGVIEVKVQHEIADSAIYSIIRMQQQAADDKPELMLMADRLSRYFVAGLLSIAAITAISWWYLHPADAFWVTLSVLVATCPCALSLATPTALASASGYLNKLGVFLTRSSVLEDIKKVKTVLFDKTGTLTEGAFSLQQTHLLGDMNESDILQLTAAIERYSEHALAKAFKNMDTSVKITDVEVIPGQGLRARWQNKTVLLGSRHLCKIEDDVHNNAQMFLLVDGQPQAAFELEDDIRPQAPELLQKMHQRGVDIWLLTGDSSAKVEQLQQQLNFDKVKKAMSPQNKQAQVQALQQTAPAMVVGDGINDAPVLASAAVSVAMGSGTEISKASSDVLLMNNDLSNISRLMDCADKTRRIIKQNLFWSLMYNAVILPLAVTGNVTPYIAVIGMSASSLIVVSNSMRLFSR